ncbi:hypothetical protein [Treponema sp.]|uniref:hypothetical protein n=1 Tax=Treponema sp. TaxID=166 RepID=UPI0025FE8767|nr:hypothetical protein [Treponema sp.]MCR5217752.1 hypothetical protein [Treponema sp.]
MKKFFFLILSVISSVTLFSQETSDLDSYFEDASDIEEAVVVKEEKTSAAQNSFLSSIKFSGNLTSSLGGGLIRKDGENDFTGYLELKNHFYIDSAKSGLYKIHGDIYTSLPSAASSEKSEGADIITLRELYFDYLLLSRAYITAGKKKTTWGYPRLFTSDSKDSSGSLDIAGNGITYDSSMNTNILADTLYGTSAQLRLPVKNGTLSALAFYRSSSSELSEENISWCFSAEFVLWNISFNLFGRKNPNQKASAVTSGLITYQPHVAGFETKTSLASFDIYAQELLKFTSVKKMLKVFSDTDTLHSSVTTAGFYRLFSFNEFDFGFNGEYQLEYIFSPEDGQEDLFHRTFAEAGLLRLGKKNNISIGLDWLHKYQEEEGYVKGGINIGGIFSCADWRTGFKATYEVKEEADLTEFVFGSWIKFTFNY